MNSANRYSSLGEVQKCSLKSKPSIRVVQLNLFCLFGCGIISSLCSLKKETLESWKHFFNKLCCEPAKKNSAAPKNHQIIAGTYGMRHDLLQGRIPSLSLNSSHDDPYGMHLDANSEASREISSSWAAALPQFICQRNAIAGDMPFVPRHYSSASDMSRHLSMDSFNQSNLDSLSLQISEHQHALRHQRRKTKKERERFLRANLGAPWCPGNRRGSDTSLQSSLFVASIAAAAKHRGVGTTVTKSTSTGDLGMLPIPGMFPPIMMPPVNNRTHIQRQAVDPPFTHGMTDNSHRLDNRVPSVSSVLPGVSANQRFTPVPSVLPNPLMGMFHQPMYGGSYDVLNTMPYGYFGGGMYPSLNGMYPGFPFNPEYMYNLYGGMPYNSFSPCGSQYQQNILPMNPIADSASETEFFPIRISDSEYTDREMRSYDESLLMTTQKLMEEHLQATAAAAAAAATAQSSSQPKPALKPQECAKNQFLKRMGSFNTKGNSATAQASRPPSGRKSPHSEAPPPSPVGSTRSLNEDELDDVFNEPAQSAEGASKVSNPFTLKTENVFQRIKSKFRAKRSTSYVHNLDKSVDFELTSKPFHSSLGQLSRTSSSVQDSSPQKEVLKEKWLHASEGISLMNGDMVAENVSR